MYNADGTKEYFFVNNIVRYLHYDESSIPKIKYLYSIAQKVDTVMPGVLKFTLKESDVEFFEKKASSLNSVFLAKELLYTKDSTIQWCFNKILLQTKDNSGLENILDTYEIPYLSYRTIGLAEHEYLVELSVSEALQYSNMLYETGLFNYVVPSFYRTNVLNNPLYTSQWGLKNTGQHCNRQLNMDINVEPAWNLSTGENIVVAVVDNGVQLNHPDLADNLLLGYDATGNGSNGGYSNSDYHGTCCAGIIAAADNIIGIKGVAFEAKIVPIRIGLNKSWPDEAAINAFEYIYNQNIDIVSCSWGGGVESPTLTNAINAVATNGRNGLGCPIFFSSGNDNESNVSFPASLSSTIAVGALSPCGERKNPNSCDGENWGSNYGSALDVVAPGVLIPTTTISSDYEMYFGGTSAACPHAAGVMALILSANPCLTATEARAILCGSCDKLNGYVFNPEEYGTWNYWVGYGKINAYNAVTNALNYYPTIYTLYSGNYSSYEIWLSLTQECSLSAGIYRANRHEIVKNITFPYMENPVIYAVANGYSIASPNNGQYFCHVSNVTHTSATLKTYVYHVLTNSIGQQVDAVIPTSINNIIFKVSIHDELETNNYINNISIVNNGYNRNAIKRIETTNFSVQGSSNVSLRAGEEIILGNGTEIQIGTLGDFHAYIEPFVSCDDTRISSKFSSKEIKAYTSTNKSYNSENQENNIDFQADLSMTLYPNPANQNFAISFTKTQENVKQVHIMDMMGKEVLRLENPSGNTINIANLPTGMYVVRVLGQGGKEYAVKLVKE